MTKRETLIEALKFYADGENYKERGLPGGVTVSGVESDGGTRARAALAFASEPKKMRQHFKRASTGRTLGEIRRELEAISGECRETIECLPVPHATLSGEYPDRALVVRELTEIAELVEEAHEHVLVLEKGPMS